MSLKSPVVEGMHKDVGRFSKRDMGIDAYSMGTDAYSNGTHPYSKGTHKNVLGTRKSKLTDKFPPWTEAYDAFLAEQAQR